MTAGQRTRGVEFNFTEPYFLGRRLAAGFDLFAKQSDVSQYSYYDNFIAGGTLRLGIPITDEITLSPRYSIYRSELSIPNSAEYPYNDCNAPIYGVTPSPHVNKFNPGTPNAVRRRPVPSYYYNCLDQRRSVVGPKTGGRRHDGDVALRLHACPTTRSTTCKNPTEGFLAELRQDHRGRRRRPSASCAPRATSATIARTLRPDHRHRALAGRRSAFSYGGSQIRIVDNFNLGPTLVRGFAPERYRTARYLERYRSGSGNPLGGTEYCGRLGGKPVSALRRSRATSA